MCGRRENYPVLRGGSSLVACSGGRAVQTGRGGGAGLQRRGPAGAGRPRGTSKPPAASTCREADPHPQGRDAAVRHRLRGLSERLCHLSTPPRTTRPAEPDSSLSGHTSMPSAHPVTGPRAMDQRPCAQDLGPGGAGIQQNSCAGDGERDLAGMSVPDAQASDGAVRVPSMARTWLGISAGRRSV